MISKGTPHNNGVRLAAYMTTGKDNERAELWQLRGFEATSIRDAFRNVEIMAVATKAEQPFFHVQVRNRDGETLVRDQWEHTANRIEGMLGLKDQPRAIAFHIDEKTGDEHMHVAWSRINEETLTATPLPFFKDRLKKLSRELELQFALEPVKNQRDGHIRFAPTRAEHEQARRLGQDIHELRDTIRECWDHSDCGKSFQGALEHEGFTLAQGDRRGFVVIDRAGGLHVLSKRVLDVSASKINDRLSDLSRDDLPTVAMARAFVEEIQQGVPTQKTGEQAAVAWDRDVYDRAWQDAVINAAIAKETLEQTLAEAGEKKATAKANGKKTGSRKKEWPIPPPTPEPTGDAPEAHFENAAIVTARQVEEPKPGQTSQRIAVKTDAPLEVFTDTKDGVSAREKEKQEARGTRGIIRSAGHYRKALDLAGIVKRQFQKLASLLTGRASDKDRALKRRTTRTDGGPVPRQRRKDILPPEAYSAIEFISETLDWLDPWYTDDETTYYSPEDFEQPDDDYLYPHP